ncbi:MarR family transcriptional regulator [Arthrobacter pigmenti]
MTLTAAKDCESPSPHATRELSAESRPGRRFEPTVERTLDNDLITLATHLPGAGEGLAIAREFHGGRGVADMVGLTRWRDGLQRRMATPVPFLRNETDCAVVAALSPKKTLTVASLSKRLGMSDEQVTRRVRSLVATGHVEHHGSGFRRALGLEPIGRAYALEAKVSDWRQGISQAMRYSTWCDAAALVLLKPPRALGEVEATCSSLGLGLAVGDRWIARPRLVRPHVGLRLAASEQWACLLIESETL